LRTGGEQGTETAGVGSQAVAKHQRTEEVRSKRFVKMVVNKDASGKNEKGCQKT